MSVNNLLFRVALGNAAAVIRIPELLISSPTH